MSSPNARIVEAPIDVAGMLAGAAGDSDGAVLVFLGVVRDHNEGRAVDHLEYKAYPAMAEATLLEIIEEAHARWRTGSISAVHRIGRLEIGEVSVAIAVASPHRQDAYEASRYVIEELKKRVPIWKREGYLDGETEWLDGSTPEAAGREG